MASQFEAMGLQPAGDSGTFFQSVPLRSMQPDPGKTSLTLTKSGKEETFAFAKNYITFADPGRLFDNKCDLERDSLPCANERAKADEPEGAEA